MRKTDSGRFSLFSPPRMSAEELESLFATLTGDRASFEPIAERMLPELTARVLVVIEEEKAALPIVNAALSNAWEARGRQVTPADIRERADEFARRYVSERSSRRPRPDPPPRTEPHEEWMDRAYMREVYQRDARYGKDLDDSP